MSIERAIGRDYESTALTAELRALESFSGSTGSHSSATTTNWRPATACAAGSLTRSDGLHREYSLLFLLLPYRGAKHYKKLNCDARSRFPKCLGVMHRQTETVLARVSQQLSQLEKR